MAEQVPGESTEAESSCEASSRLAAVVSNAQQLGQNSQAELRARLIVSAYLRLSTDQGGVRLSSCLSVCLLCRACVYLDAWPVWGCCLSLSVCHSVR